MEISFKAVSSDYYMQRQRERLGDASSVYLFKSTYLPSTVEHCVQLQLYFVGVHSTDSLHYKVIFMHLSLNYPFHAYYLMVCLS